MTLHRSPSRRWRASLSLLACVGACSVPATASAAPPTTAECLAASDVSIDAANGHRLRAERSQLLVCSDSSCPAEIRVECIRRVEEVNAAIPTIIFEARDAAGADLSEATIAMDGELLAQRIDGVALPIDPGQHAFTFERVGQPTVRKVFVIREGQKERREVITFDWQALPSKTVAGHALRVQKILAIAAAAVGVAGLGLGAAFGIDAMSKRKDAERICPDQCADNNGVALWRDAKSMGNLSTVAFVVGGVAAAAGVALWMTANTQASQGRRLQVGIGPGTVEAWGQW